MLRCPFPNPRTSGGDWITSPFAGMTKRVGRDEKSGRDERSGDRRPGIAEERPTLSQLEQLMRGRSIAAHSANAVAECGSRVVDEVELTHANPIRGDYDTDGNYMRWRRSSGPP